MSILDKIAVGSKTYDIGASGENVTYSKSNAHTSGSISEALSKAGGSFMDFELGSSFANKSVTLSIGSSSYNVTLSSSGTGTISGILETGTSTITCDSESTMVEIPYFSRYTVDGFAPDGSTVTPTDDVKTWLKCVNINKSYTTISQVLSDTTTLLALISDGNASKYMARSATWATDVCVNETAMTYIGNNATCADLLLSNSAWMNEICNSTYFEYVLNVKVPTMTSYTTPKGKVVCSSVSSGIPYAIFDITRSDSSESSSWISSSYANEYIYYMFENTVKIYKTFLTRYSSISSIYEYYVEYSNDGNTWEKASETLTYAGADSGHTSILTTPDKAKYWRVYIVNTNSGWNAGLSKLQFYGREAS